MTVRELFNDGMALLGIQNPDVSPLTARAHVLQDITAALQLMQLAGEDYYCREELDVTLAVGTGEYVLPTSVQTVLDPARLSNGKSLIGLQSRTQLDDFAPLFLGSIGALENGTPLAYFVEALKADPLTIGAATGNVVLVGGSTAGVFYLNALVNGKLSYFKSNGDFIKWTGSIWEVRSQNNLQYSYSEDDVDTPDLVETWQNGQYGFKPTSVTAETEAQTGNADSSQIILHIIPKPSAGDTLTLNVINEPPSYTAADLCGDSLIPPVPHKYHESILLPLVRKNVTLCDLFARNSAKLPAIESDYQRALVLLGLADPRQPKPPGSKVNSIRSVSAGAQPGGQQ